MKLFKTITPLLWRVIVFLCLFIIVSGVTGPRIISGGILFRDGFAIYSDIGKAVIFSIIAFALLVRHNKQRITLLAWQPKLLGWFFGSFIFFVVSWAAVNGLLAGEQSLQNVALAHIGLIVCIGFVAIGCFGLENIVILWKKYQREMTGALGIGIAFYFFLLAIYALWQPLASVVLIGVTNLLSISGLPATIVPPNTLLFDKFGITIAEFCSGIESIALFTGLYAIVGLLDWKRLNKQRYFALFPLALLLLFGLNIIRVYALIMAGYYINPDIAFSLFHTYAGMVFFILYSAVFWAFAYKYILIKEAPASKGHSS